MRTIKTVSITMECGVMQNVDLPPGEAAGSGDADARRHNPPVHRTQHSSCRNGT